jgi:hypothetical protein
MTRKQADAAFDSLRRHSSAIPPPSGPADALRLLDRAVLTKLQRDAMVHYISVGPDNLALAYSIVKAGAATFATAPFVGHERWDAGAGAADAAGTGAADAAGVRAAAGVAASAGIGAATGAGATAGVGATAGAAAGSGSGATAGAGAGAAAGSGSGGATGRPPDRDLFAARMIALADELERAEPAQRATHLLDAFTGFVSAAREGFAGGAADGPARAATPPAGAATLPAASPADPDPAVGNLFEAAGIAYLIGQLLESPPRHAATAITR